MSFKDIKLQDKTLEFLKTSIENERLPHALLFFGPDSIGKRLCAVTLAKALNCEREAPLDCCDECPSCRKIDGFNHPDVRSIVPEGAGKVIKIEMIRTMQRGIVLKPFEGRVKFFIVDNAHLLTEEAANCMLKTLEEPPRDSIIILITDHLNKIFPTIRSRCQWVLFSSAEPKVLKRLLTKEFNLTETQAHFLSHLSEGRIGKAISMKDEGTLDWKNDVLDKFSKENIIFKEDPLFFDNRRTEILDIMDVLISWYRDILILKSGADQSLLINVDRADDLRTKANLFSKETARKILDETLKTRAYIQENVNPKLALTNLACVADV